MTTATTLATRDAAMSLMSVTYYRITNSQRVVWCIKRQEQSEAESRSKVQIFPLGKRRIMSAARISDGGGARVAG